MGAFCGIGHATKSVRRATVAALEVAGRPEFPPLPGRPIGATTTQETRMDLLSWGGDAASLHQIAFAITATLALLALAMLHFFNQHIASTTAAALHLLVLSVSTGLLVDALLRKAQKDRPAAIATEHQPSALESPRGVNQTIAASGSIEPIGSLAPDPAYKLPPMPTPPPARQQANPKPPRDEIVKPNACQTVLAKSVTPSDRRGFEKVKWNSRRLSRYDHFFKKYTRKYFGENADWRWFKVQAFVESGMNPTAVSRAGAVGLMQILPSSFRQIQKMNRMFRGKSLRDPEWNIAAGIYYNRYLLRQWMRRAEPAHRLQLMFLSYNAGINHVARKIDGESPLQPELQHSFRRLPKETRRYLAKIGYYMEQYRGVAFVHPEIVCQQTPPFQPMEMTYATPNEQSLTPPS